MSVSARVFGVCLHNTHETCYTLVQIRSVQISEYFRKLCHTYECVVSHMNESCLLHLCKIEVRELMQTIEACNFLDFVVHEPQSMQLPEMCNIFNLFDAV